MIVMQRQIDSSLFMHANGHSSKAETERLAVIIHLMGHARATERMLSGRLTIRSHVNMHHTPLTLCHEETSVWRGVTLF